MAFKSPAPASASSLSRRIVIGVGIALFLILATVAWVGSRQIRGRVTRQADAGILQAAEHAATVVDRIVAERERQVRLLASLPGVVDAARSGSDRANALGLVGQPLNVLEARFDSARTLNVDPRTRQFLLDHGSSLDLAEVLVTDIHGYNVITTERTSDFVQNDEAWWQEAMKLGLSPAVASYDESARRVTISVAGAVRETEGAPPLGVVKVVYGLAPLQEAVNTAATQDLIAVEVIDSSGRVMASSKRAANLQPLPGHERLPRRPDAPIIRYNDGEMQRAAVRSTNDRTWRVVSHSPERLALADLTSGTLILGAAALGVFVVLLGALAGMNAFMTRRISAPAADLAAAAESVAGGDLSVRVIPSPADDEIGRLGRATRSMIEGLRKLTVAIKSSATETASMAQDLTASSEEISAASQQMAKMSAELSQQSADMAKTIQAMVDDSGKMVELSGELTSGVTEGVKRNLRLRGLAQENRQRLDASAKKLEALVEEAQRNVAAAATLATASEEIREFVATVQKIASQSKLLAFSAGMEASRAGAEGAGFAVVAKEVQRLADSSSEAAERTEKVVTGLLVKVEESRASSARAAAAVTSVRETTRHGVESFGQVETAVADTEAWTAAIQQASLTSKHVVEDTTRRLDELARGIETFAAAMQEVAASAQEQSASTEEIVGTASALSATAERLSDQAGAFRMEG